MSSLRKRRAEEPHLDEAAHKKQKDQEKSRESAARHRARKAESAKHLQDECKFEASANEEYKKLVAHHSQEIDMLLAQIRCKDFDEEEWRRGYQQRRTALAVGLYNGAVSANRPRWHSQAAMRQVFLHEQRLPVPMSHIDSRIYPMLPAESLPTWNHAPRMPQHPLPQSTYSSYHVAGFEPQWTTNFPDRTGPSYPTPSVNLPPLPHISPPSARLTAYHLSLQNRNGVSVNIPTTHADSSQITASPYDSGSSANAMSSRAMAVDNTSGEMIDPVLLAMGPVEFTMSNPAVARRLEEIAFSETLERHEAGLVVPSPREEEVSALPSQFNHETFRMGSQFDVPVRPVQSIQGYAVEEQAVNEQFNGQAAGMDAPWLEQDWQERFDPFFFQMEMPAPEPEQWDGTMPQNQSFRHHHPY